MTKYEVIPQKMEAHFFSGNFTREEAEELATLVGGVLEVDRVQPERTDYWGIRLPDGGYSFTGSYIAMIDGGEWHPVNRAHFESRYRKVAE